MDAEAFEAHLALHGVQRYTGHGMNLPSDRVAKVLVDDKDLPEFFRSPGFTRIDQYGPGTMSLVDDRAVPGLQEFGCWGCAALYMRKKP